MNAFLSAISTILLVVFLLGHPSYGNPGSLAKLKDRPEPSLIVPAPSATPKEKNKKTDEGPVVVNTPLTLEDITGILNDDDAGLMSSDQDENGNPVKCSPEVDPSRPLKCKPPEKLIIKTLATLYPNILAAADYFIINIIKWVRNPQTNIYSIQNEHWYLYHRSNRSWTQEQFESLRLFGARNVALLAIHLGDRKQAAETFDKLKGMDIKYTVDIKKKFASNVQHALALIELLVSAAAAPGTEIGVWGGRFYPQIPDTADIIVKSTVTVPKVILASPTFSIMGRVTSAGVALDGVTITLSGDSSQTAITANGGQFAFANLPLGQNYTVTPLHRDYSFNVANYTFTNFSGNQTANFIGVRTDSLPAPFLAAPVIVPGFAAPPSPPSNNEEPKKVELSKTYDNEGRTHWDVAIGLPAKNLTELQFNAEDNTVRTKEVSRQNAYGFLNIFPVPVDLKADRYPMMPHFVFGLPISGKPLDRPFAGAGLGVNLFKLKFDVFVGGVFNRVQEPKTLVEGQTATQSQLESDLKSKRVTKFMFGISIPVKQFTSLISGKK